MYLVKYNISASYMRNKDIKREAGTQIKEKKGIKQTAKKEKEKK
jgi:hypothetical protein